MAIELDQLQALVYAAIQDVQRLQCPDREIVLSEDLALLGPEAPMDSLALVQLIIEVEARVSTLVGHPITLTDEKAMSRQRSPFLTVSSLVEYVNQLCVESAS